MHRTLKIGVIIDTLWCDLMYLHVQYMTRAKHLCIWILILILILIWLIGTTHVSLCLCSWLVGGDSIDPQTNEARYQSQDDKDIDGLDDGEDDGAGCRGDVEGLGYDESRKEKSDEVFYENVTR